MNLLKITSFIIVFFCISCSKNQSGHLGKSKGELVADKGKPISQEATQNNTEYFSYSQSQAFEIDKSGTVITEFSDPVGKEKKLRHWMKLWEPLTNVTTSKVEGAHDHDQQIQYLNESARTAVVFSVSQQEVQRVIRFHRSTKQIGDK